MTNSNIVLVVAALMAASAAVWTLRAYRLAGGGAARALPALFSSGLVASIALAAYLVVGRPELPDAPFSSRLEALRHRDPTTYTPEETLVVLDRAAREHPNDPRPHLFSGQILLAQGRSAEAAREFGDALHRDPQSADAMLGLGRALVRVANGRVTPDALSQFRRAAALVPNDPVPWIYQAMAATQDGHVDEAQRTCSEAVTRGAPAEMCQRLVGGLMQEE
ncbi:MAG: tetratricopeptide repeat protein [Proteobacteria bacterium]|nr:tetratricopeptide repeat protein [Pseudomonadota bacterium]